MTGARSDTEPSRQTVPSEECLLSVLLGLLQSLHEIRSSILTGQASLEHVWPIDTKHGCSNFAGTQRTPSGRAERLPLKKKFCKHVLFFSSPLGDGSAFSSDPTFLTPPHRSSPPPSLHRGFPPSTGGSLPPQGVHRGSHRGFPQGVPIT